MKKWKDETAAAALQGLIEHIPALVRVERFSASHAQWIATLLGVLEEVFGRRSRYYLTIADLKWAEEGPFRVGGVADPEGSWNPQAAIERRHQQAYIRQLDFAKGILQAALDALSRSGIAGVYEGKDTPAESSAILRVLTLVERRFRKAIRAQPSKERDVQDGLETLLIGADIQYSRETDSIEYSSKTYVPDFAFEPIGLALEVKLCNRAEREKEIIAEINDDIVAYRTKYPNVVFVVYDLGFIRDVDRFVGSFDATEGIVVRVVKH